MSELEEVIDQLWLHNTFEEDPWTVDRAFAAIRDDGEVAIDGLDLGFGPQRFGTETFGFEAVEGVRAGSKTGVASGGQVSLR